MVGWVDAVNNLRLSSRCVIRMQFPNRLGKANVRLYRGSGQTHRAAPVSTAARTLDRRTHSRMAELIPPPVQGLRTALRISHPYRPCSSTPETIHLVLGQVLRLSEGAPPPADSEDVRVPD